MGIIRIVGGVLMTEASKFQQELPRDADAAATAPASAERLQSSETFSEFNEMILSMKKRVRRETSARIAVRQAAAVKRLEEQIAAQHKVVSGFEKRKVRLQKEKRVEVEKVGGESRGR